MARGSGKFKTKRGGGRSFSRNLELDANGTAVSVDRRPKTGEEGEDDDDDEDEDESEEESSEDEAPAAGPASAAAPAKKPELSREERRAQKKQAKAKPGAGADEGENSDGEVLEANANRTGARGMKLSAIADAAPSRRDREAKEKKDAQERYWKLHEQGKTDQAKTDLARLAKIRAEREAASAQRKAETEAKNAEIEAKRKAQASGKRG